MELRRNMKNILVRKSHFLIIILVIALLFIPISSSTNIKNLPEYYIDYEIAQQYYESDIAFFDMRESTDSIFNKKILTISIDDLGCECKKSQLNQYRGKDIVVLVTDKRMGDEAYTVLKEMKLFRNISVFIEPWAGFYFEKDENFEISLYQQSLIIESLSGLVNDEGLDYKDCLGNPFVFEAYMQLIMHGCPIPKIVMAEEDDPICDSGFGGYYTCETNTITLCAGADCTTLAHELIHALQYCYQDPGYEIDCLNLLSCNQFACMEIDAATRDGGCCIDGKLDPRCVERRALKSIRFHCGDQAEQVLDEMWGLCFRPGNSQCNLIDFLNTIPIQWNT